MRTLGSKRVSSMAWAAALLACAGCGQSKKNDTGSLVVPFELGNHKDCASLGVVAVRAELDEGSTSQDVDCDAGEVRFHLLKPGHYDLIVYGVDKSGVAVMDSQASGPVPVDVVGGGATVVVDPAVKLTAAPAKIMLRWDLGFGSCDSAALSTFALSAWRADGSDLLMETKVACGMNGQGREQYRLVPDKERALSGDELGEVEVQALDSHDITMGKPVTFMFDPPGPGGEVKLSLSCSDGGCKGTGTPD
ncbi:MAG: hypothetical protein ACHQ53_06270 [Polyangiales bacterium]